MSLGINSNNGINVSQNRANVKASGTSNTGNNNSVNFNYEELNKLFLEEGLSALLEKITELQNAGLVVDVQILTESDGRTTITFKANNTDYTFKGAVGDSVQSSVVKEPADNTEGIENTDEVENTTNNVSGSTDSRALTQAEVDARKASSRYYNYNGVDRPLDTDYNEINVDGVTYHIPLYPNRLSDSSIVNDNIKAICDYFNISPTSLTMLMNNITDEQKEYVNSHPEKFLGVYFEGPVFAYGSTPEMLEKHLENGDFYTADEMYYQCVKEFSKCLGEDSEWGKITGVMNSVVPMTVSNPTYNVKVNGDSIEFTDKTVKAIMDFLKENASKFGSTDNNRYDYLGCADAGYCKMLGLTPDDTEATIWQKINDFCYTNGSTDGKTMLMEDYYNACAENQTVSFTNSNYPNTSIATYETCQKIVKTNTETIKAASKEAKSKYTNTENTTTEAKSAYSNGVEEYTPEMAVGGITTNTDEDAAFNTLKQTYMQEMAERIKKYSSYGKVSDASFFVSSAIPVYSLVDIDDNGNVTLADNAKTSLKNYLQSLATAERAAIDLYDSNIEYNRSMGSNADSVYTRCAQPEFLALFGLSEVPIGGSYKNHPQMYSWIENIENIANDDSKLEELLTKYMTSAGSTDGKTTTLENYYDTIANNGICEGITTGFQSRYYYKTDAEIKAQVRNGADGSYLDSLKQKYPEIYEEYGSNIQDTYDTYNGIIRFDMYIESDGEDTAPAYDAKNRVFQYLWAKGPLLLAAGVTDGDSFSVQREKLTELGQKMGATLPAGYSNIFYIDVKDMMNYLLGDNAEGINYFDKYLQNRNAKQTTLDNTKLEVVEQNPNIEVERSGDNHSNNYWKNYSSNITSASESKEAQAKVEEIKSYIKSLLDPIYQKYYKTTGTGYVNFVIDKSDWNNPDSGDYAHIKWSWKDDATKEAFVKEVEEAIQQALGKYSDDINTITFDGQRVIFSTRYDDNIEEDDRINYNNRSNEVFGNIYLVARNSGLAKDPSEFEAATETSISYTNAPNIINNNIPSGAPTNIDGKEVVKTAWEGIYATSDSDKVYLWDAKAQKYLEINDWTSQNAERFAQGDSAYLPFIGGVTGDATIFNYCNYEVNQILLSLVYGYNRTDDPTIFEKDGKYYQLDYGTKRHKSGLEGYKDSLREITFANGTTQAKSATSSTVEDNKTEETTDTTKNETEEVVYKSEDVLTEMQAAADKLNLTAAKTTGTYYQFSAQGSYLYVWNPQTKKFKAFSINTRNADGSINQEFTQAGKAVNRTEANIYYEALLEAYKNGYDFTANYPWVCQKDGVYYEYDKEAGCFKKRT